MSKKKPSYFIVGAPKCATSALYEYLRERDDVFGCKMKEPHYFANELSDFFVMARTEEDYFGLFSGAREDQLIGEGSVISISSLRKPFKISCPLTPMPNLLPLSETR